MTNVRKSKSPAPAPQKPRIWGLDRLRGLSVLAMVIYHGLFSLVYLFGVELPWFQSFWLSELVVPLIGGSFVSLCGISTNLSRSPLRHGAQVFFWAMVLTAVTGLLLPDLIIRFGVLHLLGCCLLLAGLGQPLWERIPRGIGLGVSLGLFAFTYHLPDGYLGWRGLWSLPVGVSSPYLFPLGLPDLGFSSSDYYPLIPWFFLFMAGLFLGRWLKEGKGPRSLYEPRLPLLQWIGSHSLPIYLLHQPLLVGLFGLYFLLRGQLP